jgi:hypothetical protein
LGKNSPILPNSISPSHRVKNSRFSSKQDYEIELGKSGEFFTQCIGEFELSVFAQFNFTGTLDNKLSDFTQFNFTATLGNNFAVFIQTGQMGKSREFLTQCIAVNLNSPILPN